MTSPANRHVPKAAVPESKSQRRSAFRARVVQGPERVELLEGQVRDLEQRVRALIAENEKTLGERDEARAELRALKEQYAWEIPAAENREHQLGVAKLERGDYDDRSESPTVVSSHFPQSVSVSAFAPAADSARRGRGRGAR